MKKTALFLAMVVLLAGCNKDESSKKSNPTVSKLEVVMNVESISNDILDYFTVQYIYTDFQGKTTTKDITKAEKITFSVNNPSLGEEASTPFTVELKMTEKGTAEKASGSYDSTIKYQLALNGYDNSGSLITDSGNLVNCSSNVPYDKFTSFVSAVKNCGISSITYKTFFCKTTSGVWHIGVEGKRN